MDKVNLSIKDVAGIAEFRKDIRTDCFLCELGEQIRKNNHWPVGSRGEGRVMIVGHAPGDDEHRNGRPFVGRAGRAVQKLLWQYCGLTNDEVCYTNTVRCRPSRTTKIKRGSFRACAPYLMKEINIVDPALIVYLGADATSGTVAQEDNPGPGHFFKARIGSKQRVCYVMYHPAVVFHTPKLRNAVLSQMEILGNYIWHQFGYSGSRTPKWDHKEGNVEYITVDTIEKLKDMYYDLKQFKRIGADTETNSLNVWSQSFRLVGLSLAGEESKGYYIPIGHKMAERDLFAKKFTQLEWESQVLPTIRKLFATDTREIIFHNLAYDYRVLRKYGLAMAVMGPNGRLNYHDSMIMCYLDNEAVHSLGLKDQVAMRLHEHPKKFKDVLGNKKTFEDVHPSDATIYAVDDARNSLRLFNETLRTVTEQSNERTNGNLLTRIYPNEVENAKVMSDAHMRGVLVDKEYLSGLKQIIRADISELEDEIYKICSLAQPSSSAQLISLIQQILTTKDIKQTVWTQAERNKKNAFQKQFEDEFGNLSSQKSQLLQLLRKYRIQYEEATTSGGILPGNWNPDKMESYFKKVIKYRHLSKVLKTYVEAMLDESEQTPEQLVLHPDFKTVGTTSGRMASGSRTEEDR